MSLSFNWTRVQAAYHRRASRLLFQRRIAIRTARPLISFSFDDFPKSAWRDGGAILEQFGARGTYYVCLGLLNQDTPTGQICSLSDLKTLCEKGHELGCHTYSHCDSGLTPTRDFEKAIVDNRDALRQLVPAANFRSFSYPISTPKPYTKWRAGRHFLCCRAGGQYINTGTTDLNLLKAYFLEKSLGDLKSVLELIEHNRLMRGWLIFATHDISSKPTEYGCTPGFFAEVVKCAVASGACVLPIADAVTQLMSNGLAPSEATL